MYTINLQERMMSYFQPKQETTQPKAVMPMVSSTLLPMYPEQPQVILQLQLEIKPKYSQNSTNNLYPSLNHNDVSTGTKPISIGPSPDFTLSDIQPRQLFMSPLHVSDLKLDQIPVSTVTQQTQPQPQPQLQPQPPVQSENIPPKEIKESLLQVPKVTTKPRVLREVTDHANKPSLLPSIATLKPEVISK